MALKDISWGAVVLGAAAVTAFVAMSPALATMTGAAVAAGLSQSAASATVLGSAAAVGGIAGEFASDLFKRTRDACATLIGR